MSASGDPLLTLGGTSILATEPVDPLDELVAEAAAANPATGTASVGSAQAPPVASGPVLADLPDGPDPVGPRREGVPEESVAAPVEPPVAANVSDEVAMLVPEPGDAATSLVEDQEDPEAEPPVPFDGTVTLTTGQVVAVNPIKTKQFMKLVKLLMRGVPEQMLNSLNTEAPTFKSTLLGYMIHSMGEAPEVVLEFIQGAVSIPTDQIQGRPKDQIVALIAAFQQAMSDPDVEDTLTILEGVIALDGDHLEALGKRVVQIAQRKPPR